MRKLLAYRFFLLALVMAGCSGKSDLDWPEAGQEARPGTRWWWLGSAVDEENIKYNLQELSAAVLVPWRLRPFTECRGMPIKILIIYPRPGCLC
jgi:hypothetical protein